MTSSSRSNVVSSFTVIKGALIDETYAIFSKWDFSRSKRENLDRLRDENYIGASSATWLRDVAAVMNRRFDPDGRDRALVLLAQGGCGIEEWKPILLWHITRDEFLVRDFLVNWLFPAFDEGAFRLRPENLYTYLHGLSGRGATTEHAWTEATTKQVASSLLRIAVNFGFLRGSVVKEFAPYHLPERSFLYILHAMLYEQVSPGGIVGSPDWRMFLMRPADVEHELLRLHQFRKLEYQVAGSLVHLTLPCASAQGYAERMLA
jgi:hypothetical protein